MKSSIFLLGIAFIHGYLSDAATPIRLVGGSTSLSGRLEVYSYNRSAWGTVCDDDFDEADAEVVCRMLGYNTANATIFPNAHFGVGSGLVIVDDLQCDGNETDIAKCQSRSWYTSDCNHDEDVGVSCNTKIRLVNGSNELVGRLEVYTNGEWGSVCGENFYDSETEVVCRMLRNIADRNITGTVLYNAYYGVGADNVIMTNLDCDGDEDDISFCSSSPWLQSNGNCSHKLDVSVDCRTQVRLINGPDSFTGRVEVNTGSGWGTVCDDYFDKNDAIVICKMLGYYTHDDYVSYYERALFGLGTGPIIIDRLICNGDENDISECTSSPWYHHNCGHGEDVSVSCQGYYTSSSMATKPSTNPSAAQTAAPATPIRLVNGHNQYSGRVEVYYHGQWGTVCDDDFDHNDVKVICRMLGKFYGENYGVPYQAAHFGQGSGDIVLDDLICYGNESELSDCGSNGWLQHNCDHAEDAGVDCMAYYNGITTPGYMTTSGHSFENAISVSCNDFGWNISVDIYSLRQIYPGAIASNIYLGENTCSGLNNGRSLTFQQGLRECLTSETVSHDIHVYNNELVYAQHDHIHPFIIRHYNWTIGVECDVLRNKTSTGHLQQDSWNKTGHHVTNSSSHHEVNITFYEDVNYLNAIPGKPLHVQVGTQVYVKVFTTENDWTIKMKVHTCYTKPTPSSPENLKVYIIKDGCEVDSYTHIISQSFHETRFVFEEFEYTHHEGIYIYCDATFCGSADYSRQCIQTCNPVAKRRVAINTPGNTERDVKATTIEAPVEANKVTEE